MCQQHAMLKWTRGPCDCFSTSGRKDGRDKIIYCRLHAAAPEMADILERAMLILCEHAQYDGEDVSAETEIAQAARALLARIEGN